MLARQPAPDKNRRKKRSLCVMNVHFEPVFNAVLATQALSESPLNAVDAHNPSNLDLAWAHL